MSAVTLQCLLWNIDWLELNKGQPQPNIHKEGTAFCVTIQPIIWRLIMFHYLQQVAGEHYKGYHGCASITSQLLAASDSKNSTSNTEKCRQAHAVHTCTVLTYNVSCCCFSLPCLPDKLAQKLIWSALRLLHNCIIIHCCRPQAVLAWSRFCARL